MYIITSLKITKPAAIVSFYKIDPGLTKFWMKCLDHTCIDIYLNILLVLFKDINYVQYRH